MEGKSLDLFLCSVIIAIISTIVVSLRCATRIWIRGFWVDDWLMVVAQLLLITCATIAAVGATWGIGVPQTELRADEFEKSRLMIFLFQAVYSVTLIFVKCSICLAIYRITNSKKIRAVLIFLMAVTIATGLAILGGLLAVCHPVSHIWQPSTSGYCVKTIAIDIRDIIIFGTISAIVTDFGCAIMPYVVLWDLQIPQKQKMILAATLGLSFIACAATVVRVQYIPRYTAAYDFAYGFADPYMWTMVEIGIGTTIGSLPALKPLLKRAGLLSSSSHNGGGGRNRTTGQSSGRAGTGRFLGGSIHMQSHIVHSVTRAPSSHGSSPIPHLKLGAECDTFELLGGSTTTIEAYKGGITSRVTAGV